MNVSTGRGSRYYAPQFMVACLFLIAHLALTLRVEAAEMMAERQYNLGAGRTLILAVPLSWEDYPLIPDKASPPTIQFRGGAGQVISMLLVLPPLAGAAAAPPDKFNQTVVDTAEAIKAKSPGKSSAATPINGPAAQGSYVRLADVDPKPARFKNLMQGVLETGGIKISFSIVTGDGQAVVETAALDMLRSAHLSVGKAIAKDSVPPVPDAATFGAIFMSGNFAILDAQMASYQDAYRNGIIGDEEVQKAFLVLARKDQDMRFSYDQWVSQKPDSYVARLARARYFVKAGYDARGGAYISATNTRQIDSMREFFRLAMADLELSLKLDAKPVLSYSTMIGLAQGGGTREDAARYLAAAIAIDPRAYTPRWQYLSTLQPEWGGSLDQMQLAVDSWRAQLDEAQIIRLMRRIDDSRWKQALQPARDLVGRKQYKEAIAFYDKALEQTPISRAYAMRGYSYKELGEFEKSIADYTRALETDPDNNCGCESRQGRADSYLRLGDVKRALPDLLSAANDNDAWAIGELAAIYGFGKYGLKPDYAEAVYWCKAAAYRHDANGVYCMASLYHGGLGMKKNPEEAAHLFEYAATLGVSDAQADLASMLWNGQGMEKDHDKAINWWRIAAKQGNSRARAQLGEIKAQMSWWEYFKKVRLPDWQESWQNATQWLSRMLANFGVKP